MKYAHLVVGPAGSGKSSFCTTMVREAESTNRVINVVNLDPAAEIFDYECVSDIRNLISVEDVMNDDELKLGPNGGLIFCMEYLAHNFDWLHEQIGDVDEDYFLFDCPGQVELYTHLPVMRHLVESLQSWDFRVGVTFLIDTQFMLDTSKFLSGVLLALSSMISIEVPTVNILTKMDLLSDRNRTLIDSFLNPDTRELLDREPDVFWTSKYRKLSESLASVLDDYSMIRLIPMDIKDDDSITDVLYTIDSAIQYGEDLDVKDRYPQESDDEPKGNGLL